MSSKLDYLKKYGVQGDGDGKKKRRKKAAKTGRQGPDVTATRKGGGLRIIDDEADMAIVDRKKVDKAWEDEEAEEEKPVMVLDDPEDGKVAQTGSWTTVGDGGIKQDASPPRRRKRHDSSDEDASPPRRNPRQSTQQDASPPRRRRRHHSSDEDASPPRRNAIADASRGAGVGTSEDTSPPRRRQRRDSPDSDASPPRRNPRGDRSREEDNDASPPRRNRAKHNLEPRTSRDEGASPPRKPKTSPGHDDRPDAGRRSGGDRNGRERGNGERRRGDQSPPRRRRHDSSDSNDASPPRSKSAGRRRDSRRRSPARTHRRDTSPARRSSAGRRPDPDADSDPSPPRRRNRESDGGGRKKRDEAKSGRRRHDSPEPESGSRGAGKGERGREEENGSERAKTSSGYYAGLQSGQDFKAVEEELKRKHDAEMKGADTAASGQGATTVYRDKKGRKLDMLNEFMRQQDARQGKEVAQKEAQFEWGRGKVQKDKDKEWKEEVENIAAEPFARTIDDSRLEAERRAEIRADDPMAAYIAKRQVKQKANSGVPARPEYKGPPPKPNRFNIRPGYRWDGVDRGNGWEDKIVQKGVDTQYKAELAYKWATADM